MPGARRCTLAVFARTHNGDLMGIPPTRRRGETHGCSVVEIRDGKAVRTWVYWDTAHLLRQLGVMPG
jgi:predicted ester cyclase